MKRRTSKPKAASTARRQTEAFRAAGDAALRRYNASWELLPKCGAHAKHSGLPCKKPAMKNGRCYWHGGATPSGDGWHKPVWPHADAPDAVERLNRKLRDLERRQRKRAARLARMTPEERARHEKWHRDHPTGSRAEREAAKAGRRQNDAARACLAPFVAGVGPDRARDPELEALGARRAELEAQLALIEAALAGRHDPLPGYTKDDLEIFG